MKKGGRPLEIINSQGQELRWRNSFSGAGRAKMGNNFTGAGTGALVENKNLEEVAIAGA